MRRSFSRRAHRSSAWCLRAARKQLSTRAYLDASSRPTPRTLRSNLPSRRLQLHSITQDVVTSLALPGEPSERELQRWGRNLEVLHNVHGPAGTERVRKTVLANPALLAADLELWHSFLVSGFRLPPDLFAKLASDCPALLTGGDVFGAGCVMLFFKGMGWSNKHVAQRIIGYYPQLLLLDCRRDIDPVLTFLHGVGCRGDDLRLLVWEFPRIFDKDYRRHVRKFQHLGVYGLSLSQSAAATAAAAAAADGDGAAGAGGGVGGGSADDLYGSALPILLEWF